MAPSGRTPDEGVPRDRTLTLRLTPEAQKALDAGRGETSRSTFVRTAIEEKLRRGKK